MTNMDKHEELLFKMNAIGYFKKYMPLLYTNDILWEEFQLLCRRLFHDRDDEFFAFHRDPDCALTWLALICNMGGGVPFYFFQASDFIILAYKDQGFDIDEELKNAPAEYRNLEYID